MKERNVFEILSVLERNNRPMTSGEIKAELDDIGIRLTDRMIRNYLQDFDKKGFTKNLGKEGRCITDVGRDELKTGYVYARTDFIFDKIVRMITETKFDVNRCRGEVIVNLSYILEKEESRALKVLEDVCSSGVFPPFICVRHEGEKLCNRFVPEGKIGIVTMSSITVDQMLLNEGIYSIISWGIILEIKNHRPTRCVDIVNAIGCSFDPLGFFIEKKAASVYGAATTGTGRILGDYREFPYTSRVKAIKLLRGGLEVLGGKVAVGRAGEDIFGIHPKETYTPVVAFSGESLPAALEEKGIETNTETIDGAINFRELEPIAPVKGEVILL
ncbi:MAG: DUF128 domain-containing protein [Candidatus Altiarchaeota archaeon]|nr:DUF128 domain-containing protein [Candidatus Altiarchaeota archaeon]